MKNWHEFITMGGYAIYVWPSYGIAFIVMLANAIWPGHLRRRLLKELRQRLRSEDRHT